SFSILLENISTIPNAMNTIIFFIFALSAFFVLGYSTQRPIENELFSQNAESVEGSWQLISRIDHAGGDTAWTELPDNIIYQKHITPTHFTWISYNTEEDVMSGAGGGTYTYIGDIYVEDIHFFYPPGSS